ncbi:MAG: hypothetical protein ACOVO0_07085, partial [Burkholderiaceae bacterium]
DKFRPAFDRRMHSPDYEPAFDLDAALSQARRMTGRDDAGAHLGDNLSAHLGSHAVPTPSEAAP